MTTRNRTIGDSQAVAPSVTRPVGKVTCGGKLQRVTAFASRHKLVIRRDMTMRMLRAGSRDSKWPSKIDRAAAAIVRRLR